MSIAPFVFSLILSQRLLSFSKINNHQQWVRWFGYARYFVIFLLAAELFFSASNSTKWVWHIFLVSLVVFAFQQKEMRPLRMFLLAYAPYVLVSLLSDFSELIINDFYNRYHNYFETVSMLSVIWLVAIIFSDYKQKKSAEKERINREKEDAINRAIAIRKVELEGLVAERTAELTQQKEELENTLNTLRTTQTQLIQSEKMASLGELTAGIAHEIQNPLNFVNNFSEINSELIAELDEERKKENRDFDNEEDILRNLKENEQKINHHGKRAEAIVRGMLQHSRSSTGKKEPTDINALADEYLRLAYHGLRAKDKSFNATMITDFDENLSADKEGGGKINVIPEDIGRVILNLITNAFYAVNEKKRNLAFQPSRNESGTSSEGELYEPTVTVGTSLIPPSGASPGLSGGRGAGTVKVSVKDNGNGIPPAALEKIFQPFFTTKPSGQGTGLGLSISYEIVTKLHGGEIKVTTKENEGTEFIVILPA